MRNRMRMLNFGELGECQLVKDLHDKEKRVYKLSRVQPRRPTEHRFASEWSAWDQVCMWELRWPLDGSQSSPKRLPPCSQTAPTHSLVGSHTAMGDPQTVRRVTP